MKTKLLLLSLCAAPVLASAQDADWKPLFDGQTLKGWNGDPKFWSVQDGAITGKTTADNTTKGNTFLVWEGGEVADFELKLEYKIVGGNSGLQYRSFRLPNGADQWRIGGYQADFEAGDTYSGILYGEAFRGILCLRGQKTVINEDGKPQKVGDVGDPATIQAQIKKEDWNQLHVTAKGFHFVHRINGVVTAECTDEDTDMRREGGLLALQLHAGPPMTVQFRNIQIKHTGAPQAAKSAPAPAPDAGRGEARNQQPPTDDTNELILQVDREGGFVLRTKRLTPAGLEEALRGLAQANPHAKVAVRGRNAAPDAVEKAKAALKKAEIAETELTR